MLWRVGFGDALPKLLSGISQIRNLLISESVWDLLFSGVRGVFSRTGFMQTVRPTSIHNRHCVLPSHQSPSSVERRIFKVRYLGLVRSVKSSVPLDATQIFKVAFVSCAMFAALFLVKVQVVVDFGVDVPC